jgi:hypothetical protein
LLIAGADLRRFLAVLQALYLNYNKYLRWKAKKSLSFGNLFPSLRHDRCTRIPSLQPCPCPTPGSPHASPRLLADIGGTNARFALETGPGRIEAIEVLACAAYPTLGDATRAYLALPRSGRGGNGAPCGRRDRQPGDGRHGAHDQSPLGILDRGAAPRVGFETFVVVNDFERWRWRCRTWLSTTSNRSAAAQPLPVRRSACSAPAPAWACPA